MKLLILMLGISMLAVGKQFKKDQRDGKIFSLFSIVTFQNNGCITQQGSTSIGMTRNGTCYTTTECRDRGGTASGHCASGFGVCCFFQIMKTGSFSQNSTYIRNPGFPTATTEAATITYTVNKESRDVCDLRLDFETFDLRGPTAVTDGATGDDCPDKMTIASSSSFKIPDICGLNSGQHIYVDMGNTATDTATITFAFAAATGEPRSWEIQATQIQCWSSSRPPSGCLQYFTTLTGRITSFNFQKPNSMHLPKQDYSVCIRQNAGYCCVEYQTCISEANSFSLDNKSAVKDTSEIGKACDSDYIEISGGSFGCNAQPGAAMANSRFCGRVLNTSSGAAVNEQTPICDCSAPFTVRIVTNAAGAADTGAIANSTPDRGLCLDYTQHICQ